MSYEPLPIKEAMRDLKTAVDAVIVESAKALHSAKVANDDLAYAIIARQLRYLGEYGVDVDEYLERRRR